MLKRQWICGGVNTGVFLIGAVLLAAGIVVLVKVFPDVVAKTIKARKVFGLNDDGTLNDFTRAWANPSQVSTMQYWVFDYKNTIGILNRALYPDMDEKGPYAYEETFLNTHLEFTANGEQMQFARSTRYKYNPSKSCPKCDPKKDTVTIPDISFFIGMQKIDAMVENFLGNEKVIEICRQTILKEKCAKLSKLVEREIGSFVAFFKTEPFVAVTVDQLLFSGYASPLVTKLANRVIQISNTLIGTDFPPIDATAFTVVLNKNNATTDTVYTVQTGKDDYSRAGYTLFFTNLSNSSLPSNGNKLPSQWWPRADTKSCSGFALTLEGTNGDFFKSFIEKTDSLPMYVSDICRSATLKYEKKVSVLGIPAYRFLLPSEQFDYSLADNCGFCNPNTFREYGAYDRPPNSSCLPSGLLDISGCQKGPVIISKPHFYKASNIVRSFVPRFRPSYENDETILDIEPNTGTILAAKKRLQVNMLLNQFFKIGAYSVIRPGAYPLIWINESYLIDEGTRNVLSSQVLVPKNTIEIICLCAIGLGGFLMILSAALCLVNMYCLGDKEEHKRE